jgi:hypothetical protein
MWFDFNGKNTVDEFGDKLVITNYNIGVPSIKQNTIDIPFSSKVVDYSFINGSNFEHRKITFDLNIENDSLEDLHGLHSRLLYWLYSPTEYKKLILEGMENTYFLAKCINVSELDQLCKISGNLSIEFDCYPFRRYSEQYNSDFILTYNKEIIINGYQMPVIPILTVSKDCKISFKNKEYLLTEGENIISDIVFEIGENKIISLTRDTINLNIQFERGIL